MKDAVLVATLFADEESNKEDALLALTFYYSQKENKNELKQVMSAMMLDK